jgi:hypothetical protein
MYLSIILPGIRPHKWLALYQSISNATTITDYEVVIVSPYDLPPELADKDNIRLVKDKGCPTRCSQLGLLHSQGEYVTWAADDGVYSPTLAIDNGFAARPQDHKGVVSLRYGEGTANKKFGIDHVKWWRMQHHKILRNLPYIPNHYIIVMIALIRRDYFVEVGGWDCRFEQMGISNLDLAIRLQNDGANVVLGGPKLFHFAHEINNEEHKPIEDAHNFNDLPLLNKTYSEEANRGRVDFDNWKQAQAVWTRRFGDK